MSLPEPVPEPQLPTPTVLRNAVDATLDALDAPEAEDTSRGWSIDNADQADWAGRKRALLLEELADVHQRAERQRAAIMAAVQPYLDPIDEWAKDRSEKLSREVENWEALLMAFHRHEVESATDDPPLTIKLPHVELHSRKSPDRWEFSDEFVVWATEHRSDLLRLEVDKPAAKKAITIDGSGWATAEADAPDEDGEIVQRAVTVPGVTVTVGERSYWVDRKERGQ